MAFWLSFFMTFHSFVGIDFYTVFYMRFPWKAPPFQLLLAPSRLPFGSVGVLLAPFRLPLGSILVPFSVARKWYIPLGAHWLPLAPFQLHFGTRWLTFGSLLAAFGSHLAPFWRAFPPFGVPFRQTSVARKRYETASSSTAAKPRARSKKSQSYGVEAVALTLWCSSCGVDRKR